MKKKYYIGIIVLALLALHAITVFAEDRDDLKYSYGHFYYHTHDGYVSICGYLGKETLVKVPSVISGRPVAEIESGAFSGCDSIRIVTIPDTVDTIHEDSFQGMPSLVKIISDTVGVEIKAEEGVEVLYTSDRNSDGTADDEPVNSEMSEAKANVSSEKTKDNISVQAGKDDKAKDSSSAKVTERDGFDDSQADDNSAGEETGKKNIDSNTGTGADVDDVVTEGGVNSSDLKNTTASTNRKGSGVDNKKTTGSADNKGGGNYTYQNQPVGMGEGEYIEPEPESVKDLSDDKDATDGKPLTDNESSVDKKVQDGDLNSDENEDIPDGSEESDSEIVKPDNEKSSHGNGLKFAITAALIILIMGTVSFVIIKRQ